MLSAYSWAVRMTQNVIDLSFSKEEVLLDVLCRLERHPGAVEKPSLSSITLQLDFAFIKESVKLRREGQKKRLCRIDEARVRKGKSLVLV